MKNIIPYLRRRFCQAKYVFRNWGKVKLAFYNYFYDAKRFLKYSITSERSMELAQYEARIFAHFHVIEKGLTLKKTRPGYGQDIINSLLSLLREYSNQEFSVDRIAYKAALSTLQSYVAYHEERNYDVQNLKNALCDFGQPNPGLGGAIDLTQEEIAEAAHSNFVDLANSRYSVRHFSQQPVALSLLEQAITIAQKTPSVCNRQATRVHIIQDKTLKQVILKYQTGNRGFGEHADKLLMITSDLRNFFGIHERNQGFIDAGMFSMSLLYALHYFGLGTCTLNWSVNKDIDKQLRQEINIGEYEIIILFIAVGHLPSRFKVAKSIRKSLDEIMEVH